MTQLKLTKQFAQTVAPVLPEDIVHASKISRVTVSKRTHAHQIVGRRLRLPGLRLSQSWQRSFTRL